MAVQSDPITGTGLPASIPAPTGQQPSWLTRHLGLIGFAAYLIVLLSYCASRGVPLDRIGQIGWLLAGIVAAQLGRSWRQQLRVILHWLPLLGALLLYDYTRGIADTLGMPVLVGDLVSTERSLFGGVVPTVWLQDQAHDPGIVYWWDVIASLVYFSHFVVPWALAAVFYVRLRPLWWPYMRRVLLLFYAGLLTYLVLPAAPPWFAANAGVITDDVSRIPTPWDGICWVCGLRARGCPRPRRASTRWRPCPRCIRPSRC